MRKAFGKVVMASNGSCLKKTVGTVVMVRAASSGSLPWATNIVMMKATSSGSLPWVTSLVMDTDPTSAMT